MLQLLCDSKSQMASELHYWWTCIGKGSAPAACTAGLFIDDEIGCTRVVWRQEALFYQKVQR